MVAQGQVIHGLVQCAAGFAFLAQFLNLPLFQVIILMQPGIGKGVFIQRECKFTVKKQRKFVSLICVNRGMGYSSTAILLTLQYFILTPYDFCILCDFAAENAFSQIQIKVPLHDRTAVPIDSSKIYPTAGKRSPRCKNANALAFKFRS